MRRIYIAGKWEARGRLRAERERIEQGHTGRVISSWLDYTEAEEPTTDMRRGYAYRDLRELANADLLILDTLDENHRGGREVEYGIAMARGTTRWIVGPTRNIFHLLADWVFTTWDEAREALTREAQRG